MRAVYATLRRACRVIECTSHTTVSACINIDHMRRHVTHNYHLDSLGSMVTVCSARTYRTSRQGRVKRQNATWYHARTYPSIAYPIFCPVLLIAGSVVAKRFPHHAAGTGNRDAHHPDALLRLDTQPHPRSWVFHMLPVIGVCITRSAACPPLTRR